MRHPLFRTLLIAGSIGAACGSPPPVPTAGTALATPIPVPTPRPTIVAGVPIGQTDPADLTLRFVQRLPSIDYVWASNNPTVEGWPARGQPVTWRAHVKNWASFPLPAVDYTWTLDGAVAQSGTFDLGPGAEATLDFRWSWDPSRHELELIVDSGHRFTVRDGPRNRLRLHTDALSVGFYVEESVYRLFRERQHQLRIGNSSFEDWAQLQVRFYNDLFANAVFPETPNGVLDRLRLDNLTVVPDGALPLSRVETVGDNVDQRIFAIFRPHGADRTVDLQFGFPSSTVGDYANFSSTSTSNNFYYSGYVQHELGHARYLVDTHALNVFHGVQGRRIDIIEGGVAVAGSRYMPGTPISGSLGDGLRVHRTRYPGLMESDWTLMDRYAAAAWNLIAGHRATRGNYNSPENIGVYVDDLPRENRLTLRDTAGAVLPGATVRVYQSAGRSFDNTPDLETVADDRAQVFLGRNPFTRGNPIGVGLDNGVAIVRVQHGERVGYGFLEVADLNLAYWRGETELADHELRVALY